MPKDARSTVPDSPLPEEAVPHVIHDYTILLWCRWAIQQDDSKFSPIVRSVLAFSYFLPYRAFAEFFSMSRYVPRDNKTGEIDMHAIDFSRQPSYEDTQWKKWLPHMNTHLFHLNYFRTRNPPQFDSMTVIEAIHPEFEGNWKNFIAELQGDFRRLFKEEMDSRRSSLPELTLYP